MALFESISERIKSCQEAERVKELAGLLGFVAAKLLRSSQPLNPEESRRSLICSA
jgi:hypothetical protein